MNIMKINKRKKKRKEIQKWNSSNKPMTGSKIHACLKNRLIYTKKETRFHLAVTTSTGKHYFSPATGGEDCLAAHQQQPLQKISTRPQDRPSNSQITKMTLLLTVISANIPHQNIYWT